MNILDKIIDYAGKVQQAADLFAPGVGSSIGVGVYVAKALQDQWNAAHPAEPPVVLPDDAALIRRLMDTSTRGKTTGLAFLADG